MRFLNLSHVGLHSIALHSIALHSVALHSIALHSIALHSVALHSVALHTVGRLPIFVLLLVVLATAPAKAQTVRNWIDPTGGNYNDFTNWSPFAVPDTIGESAQFNIAGTYDVTLSSGVTTLVSDLRVSDGDVTFNASGAATAIYEMDDDLLISSNLTLMQEPGLGDVTLNVGDLLQINSGSTVDVLQGSDVTASQLDVGNSGDNSTMIIDGVGSSLAVSTLTRLGLGSTTGTLTFQNGSTGNSLSGSVEFIANSSQIGSTGRLNVLSGSTLQTGNINIGESGSIFASQEGTLTVDGTSSTLTMTGASTLIVGDDDNSNVVSDVIVSNSAVMNTGTGAILIQNLGHLVIAAGTFNANGNLTVDDGTITRGGGSNGFNLASGLTLTAQNRALIDFGGAYSIDQGTTFDIQANSDFTTTGSLNIGDGGGDGTLIVDGVGSSVTNGAASFWGSDGNTANVTFRNSATGVLSLTNIASSTTAGTTGILNIESGADVTASDIYLAANGGSTTSGTITMNGLGSSLVQNGSSDLVVGHATSGTATININTGVFRTGSGTTTVNATGTINIGGSSGILDANGDLTIDGGTITRGTGSSGFDLASGLTLTAKNDAQINFGGAYSLDQGTTFDIQSGADFLTSDVLDIGSGTLVVDGIGSSVTTGTGASVWGSNSGQADVTFRNGATGNLGSITLAISSLGGTTGIFRVESGATVTTDFLQVADFNGNSTSGTITVNGVGSSLTQNGTSGLTLGHATISTATLNVQNSGTFTTGTGLIAVDTTGTVNVQSGGVFNLLGNLNLNGAFNLVGGTLSAVDPVITSGSINFVFGTVELNGNQALDSQQLAGLDIGSLDPGKTLRVNGVATLLTPLTLAGGKLVAESLVNSFLLDFQSGTFELTSDNLVIGQTGLFGPSYVLETSRTFNVTNTTTIDVGSILEIKDGASFSAGTLNVNGEFKLSGLNAIGGGSIVNNAGLIRGVGRVNGLVSNSGLIQAFDQTDELIFNHPVTNETGGLIAIRDSAVRFGQGLTNSGQLSFGPGTSDLIGDLTNDGTMGLSADTIVSVVGDIVQNSTLNLLSGSRLIIFDDYSGPQGTTGPGTLEVLGLLSPGSSPAELDFGGDLVLGTGTLIELGGTTKGSQYDALNITGLATLGGILDVQLINGFAPTAGNSFDILTASGSIGNAFATVNLPALSSGLTWNVNQGANLLSLAVGLAGDYNGDGTVDAADYTVWRDNEGAPAGTLPNDTDGGVIGAAQYNSWVANFGATASISTSVPEPSGLALLACMAMQLTSRRKRFL